jgi:aspartate/methionine/tyrosine aminotransferase
VEALVQCAGHHDYLPTAGLPELRKAIADYYRLHFGLDCVPGEVVVSPGSKQMISMILAVLQGVVLIPVPSWVSYLPQAEILRKQVIILRTRQEDRFKLTPELLLRQIQGLGTEQKILIFNQPHNPTGVLYGKDELAALAEVCRQHRVVVVADEIYARTSFAPDQFTSMARLLPEATIVTGGLSKDRSCGGYRLGVGTFPGNRRELVKNVLKVAGSTYSCVAAPIQHAALVAYSADAEVDAHVEDTRALNALIGRTTASLFANLPGATTTTPEGGFYLYVDLNSFHDRFARLGLGTAGKLAKDLLRLEHVALLPGEALLLREEDLSFRCSFVDYDGEEALRSWRDESPIAPEEEEAFDSFVPDLPGSPVRQRRPDPAGSTGVFCNRWCNSRRPDHLRRRDPASCGFSNGHRARTELD